MHERDGLVPGGHLLRERAGRIDDEGRAVEDQLVLAADAIHIDDREPGLARPRVDLRAAQAVLSRVIRRAVRDQQHLRAGRLRARGGLGEPDVLADDDAEADAIDVEHARVAARLEVPLLVEHRVVWQVVLAVNLRNAAVADDGDGVVAARARALGKAHQHGAARHRGGERREFARARVDERRAQQQVFRGIAAQRELGRDDQRRTGTLRFRDRRQDAARVGGEVADPLIELRNSELHRSILASAPRAPSFRGWTATRAA